MSNSRNRVQEMMVHPYLVEYYTVLITKIVSIIGKMLI